MVECEQCWLSDISALYIRITQKFTRSAIQYCRSNTHAYTWHTNINFVSFCPCIRSDWNLLVPKNAHTHDYKYIYIFFNLSVPCMFCLVAILMDLKTKYLKTHSSKLVLAIMYMYMQNIVRTNLLLRILSHLVVSSLRKEATWNKLVGEKEKNLHII